MWKTSSAPGSELALKGFRAHTDRGRFGEAGVVGHLHIRMTLYGRLESASECSVQVEDFSRGGPWSKQLCFNSRCADTHNTALQANHVREDQSLNTALHMRGARMATLFLLRSSFLHMSSLA